MSVALSEVLNLSVLRSCHSLTWCELKCYTIWLRREWGSSLECSANPASPWKSSGPRYSSITLVLSWAIALTLSFSLAFLGPWRAAGRGGGCPAEASAGESEHGSQAEKNGGRPTGAWRPKLKAAQSECGLFSLLLIQHSLWKACTPVCTYESYTVSLMGPFHLVSAGSRRESMQVLGEVV